MNNETKHTPEVLEAAQKLLKQVVYAHTPGPWGIIKETQPGQMERLFVGHIGLTVAEIPLGLYNTEANARLIASAPDMAKEIAQLKQQNEELKAHEQEIRDCWTEERTDHNKAREEIAQLRADNRELLKGLTDLETNWPVWLGGPLSKQWLDNLRNIISKHTKV